MHFEHFGLTDLSEIQIIYFRKRQKVEFKVRTQNLRQADGDKNFLTKSYVKLDRLISVQIQASHFWDEFYNAVATISRSKS